MTLLQWKSEYALGIPSVDHEHRELIEQINGLYAHIEGSADAAAIEACLEDIYAGIAAHFALEERHMREAAYDDYRAHKEEHEDLLDQIRDLMDEFADDPAAGQVVLRERLAQWFGRHFATADARLHHHLGEHG
jgi:hemerythrin-like metal-binding protein